ncbi:MAG: hypothetical protein ABF271_02000 [Abyssibacter sp.]|uniref:hypothetical protein n=1 Tax=Abyssibacter sp. TaxID=2320200 RepID=UPI0032198428
MTPLRGLLVISTLAIYGFTIAASLSQGLFWPAIAVHDLMALGWRAQFDVDFIIHLLLLATWVVWREGADGRAYLFGFLSVVMGGMFSFPYLLHATYKAHGEPRALLLGVHAPAPARVQA